MPIPLTTPADPGAADSMTPQLSIVVPMHNEEANIEAFFTKLHEALAPLELSFEILCIDDGSTDATWEKLTARAEQDTLIRLLRLSRNFGKDVALTAGINEARGRAVIPIDADLQHPPEVIGEMVAKWREGYDMVYAVRRTRDTDPPLRRLSSMAFYWIFELLSDVRLPRGAGDFRLIDRRIVEVMRHMPERDRFMKGIFAWVGFKHIGVEYDPAPRYAGTTTWSFYRLIRFAFSGLTSFSNFPLTVSAYVGALIAVPSLLLGIYYLIRFLLFDADVPGFPSIIVAVLSLGGMQLLILGLIGNYLGRIFNEVKRRPLYVVSEVRGFGPPRTRANLPDDGGPTADSVKATGGHGAGTH